MKHKHTQTAFKKKFLIMGLAAISPALLAAPLDIANNALEIATGVEPNIMVLNDDSGSMDWGIITTVNQDRGVMHLPDTSSSDNRAYFYTHPSPGATGNTPSVPTSFFERVTSFDEVMPDPEFMAAQGLAAPQGGAWRAWNHNYNAIYYNPNVVYVPWKGVDVNGDVYTDATIDAAVYNPYRPGDGSLDLTSTLSYETDCTLAACGAIGALDDDFIVTNFYPARYYKWTDDGDGVVEDDDTHTLVEIKSSTASYARTGVRTDCGGDGDSATSATCAYAKEIQNFANWFSYYRKRDLTAKAAFSRSMESATSARIGLATINNNAGNRIQVASMNISPDAGNKKDLYDSLFKSRPHTTTPLRQSLRDTGRYFACESSNIFGTGSSNPGDADCPVEAAPAGNCQQNYTILMTDGFWNESSPGVGNADNDNSPNAAPGPFDGASFADGDDNTLADVAMHYYERDLHGSLADDVPTTTLDVNRYNGATDPFETMHQHMATYTIGFGVSGTLSSSPPNSVDAFAWPTPVSDTNTTTDDLRHAAWNGRGQFLSASDPEKLTDALDKIFTEIAAGTGAASSVAFNTQNLESGALVFRAFFDTNTNTGDMVAQPVTISGEVVDSEEWSAAEALDSQVSASSDTRNIITYQSGVGIPFQWADLDATQQSQLNLPAATGGDISTAPDPLGEKRLNYIRGQSENEGPSLVSGQFRERKVSKGKLGDIVHSSPVFVGSPPFIGRDAAPYPTVLADLYSQFAITKKARRESIYVGANDGMLHSLDANTGEEIFGYVPNILFGELSELTDPDYVHQFYVDASPSLNDIFFTPTRGTNAGTASWNTVLVGALAAGGKGYFALNVTDPDDLDSETEAKRNVLWEFTAEDDIDTTLPIVASGNDLNLGLSFSEPLIAMSNVSDGSNNRWVAIFGNGYNSASTDGDAELYVLFIDAGQDGTWTRGSDFIKLSTGNGKAQSGDGTTPNGISGIRGIDTDLNGTVDVVYAGDLQGNVYRFDLSGTSTSALQSSSVQTLYTTKYSVDSTVQPITNAPIVIKHPSEAGYIVLVGTGSYLTNADATSTDIQSIYGLWDDFTLPSDSITAVTTSRLQEQSFTNVTAPVSGFTVRTLTDTSFTWGHNGTKKEGWFIDLDVPESGGGIEFPGERAIRNFLIRGDFVFVNTVIPKASTACNTGPGGFELGFNPATGGSGANTVFDLNGDGIFDENDNVDGLVGEANVVSGTRFDDATPTDSSFIGNRKITQTSDKKIRSTGTNTDGGNKVGRHSWREIEF